MAKIKVFSKTKEISKNVEGLTEKIDELKTNMDQYFRLLTEARAKNRKESPRAGGKKKTGRISSWEQIRREEQLQEEKKKQEEEKREKELQQREQESKPEKRRGS